MRFAAGVVLGVLVAFLLALVTQPQTIAVPIPIPAPVALPVPIPVVVFDPAAEVLAQVNDLRVPRGLPRLTRDVRLENAAREYAIAMAYGRYFGHDSPSGSTPLSRIVDQGYPLDVQHSWWYGETMCAGYPTSQAAVAAWMASPHHRDILLSARARDVGIGYTRVAGSEYVTYWVADFGAKS